MPSRQEIGNMLDSLRKQEGGDHYRKYAIQPAEYSARNGLSFLAGNVVKYVTRYKDKGGAEDIRKAMHYLELIMEFEYPLPKSYSATHEAPLAGPQNYHETNQCAVGAVPDFHETNSSGPKLILKLESKSLDTLQEQFKP